MLKKKAIKNLQKGMEALSRTGDRQSAPRDSMTANYSHVRIQNAQGLKILAISQASPLPILASALPTLANPLWPPQV